MSGVMPLAVAPIGGVAEYLGGFLALAFAAIMVGLSVWILNSLFPSLKRISLQLVYCLFKKCERYDSWFTYKDRYRFSIPIMLKDVSEGNGC